MALVEDGAVLVARQLELGSSGYTTERLEEELDYIALEIQVALL